MLGLIYTRKGSYDPLVFVVQVSIWCSVSESLGGLDAKNGINTALSPLRCRLHHLHLF